MLNVSSPSPIYDDENSNADIDGSNKKNTSMANTNDPSARPTLNNVNVSNQNYSNVENNLKFTYEFKIILLGSISVGKTSILSRYTANEFREDYKCTIKSDFKVKAINVNNNTQAKLTIWDTCGDEKFRAITRQYYKEAQGILLVYDITNKESFDNLKNWIMQSEESIEDFKKIIIGNKIDLEKERQVTKELLEQFCQGRDIQGFEISAKNDVNNIEISKCFETLVQLIIEGKSKEQLLDRFSEDSRSRSKSVISYNKHTKKRKKKCC